MFKEQTWTQQARLIVTILLLCSLLTEGFANSVAPQSPADIRDAAEAAVLEYLERAGIEIEEAVIEQIGQVELYPEHGQFHDPSCAETAPRAAVTGVVYDQSDAVLPGVRIVYKLLDGSYKRISAAGHRGRFSLTNLETGPAELRFGMTGFTTSIYRFDLECGRDLFLAHQLKVGDPNPIITIRREKLLPDSVTGAFVSLTLLGPQQGLFHLRFSGEEALVVRELRGKTPYDPEGRSLDRALQSELDSFFRVLPDIRQGPDRFLPFISRDTLERILRVHIPEAAGSSQDFQLWTAHLIDWVACQAWEELESIRIEEPQEPESETDFAAMAASSAERRRRVLQALGERGTLGDEHYWQVEPYLRRYLGEGLVAAEDPGRTLPSPLPAGPVYIQVLFPHLTLAWARTSDRFQIVGVGIDD